MEERDQSVLRGVNFPFSYLLIRNKVQNIEMFKIHTPEDNIIINCLLTFPIRELKVSPALYFRNIRKLPIYMSIVEEVWLSN